MIKSLNNGSWQETEMQSWLLAGSSLMNRFVLVVMMVTGDGDDGDDGCFVPFVLLTNGDGGGD